MYHQDFFDDIDRDSMFSDSHISLDNLEFHVFAVIDFSSQYGSDHSISYTASNVIGPPKRYPRSVDTTSCFQMRTYGSWRKQLPSFEFVNFSSVLPDGMTASSEDFIEVRFTDRIYPARVDMYEIFNPGAVIKIFGYCYEKSRWKMLWQCTPEACFENCRVLKANLNGVDFRTNCLRLEFFHGHLDYYYGLDAIMLHETLDFHPSSQFREDGQSSAPKETKDKNFESFEVETESASVASHFGKLPSEVMLVILGLLDLKSLCAASQVSSWFKNVCYDPILYRALDLQLYWNQVTPSMLDGLSGRCSSLQRLNMSWCGSRNLLNQQYFIQFLEQSCCLLTCLKLSNCAFVSNHVLRTIATSCKYIQVLELRSCRNQELNHTGFSQIALLENLVYLDLYRTAVDRYSIMTIVKSCYKLEHLLLGGCHNVGHYNDVVREIGRCLRSLKTLELWRARSLTEVGLCILSEQCQELVELDLGWCIGINSNNGCLRQLIKNCTKLKKLSLTAVRTVSDSELAIIAYYSQELQQLDILGTREITYEGVRGILQGCEKLKLLDISFCQKISDHYYDELRHEFPGVQIKRSMRSGIPF